MADRPCLISLRAWGDYACMTRPEFKGERVSYGILTPSAARGILESIFFEPQFFYVIHEIGVINRGRWFSFRRNEVAKVVSLSKAVAGMADPGSFRRIHAGGGSEDGTQRGMLALADVAYLITAEIRLTARARPPRDNLAKYRDLFQARAARGKCFQRPYLGMREFAADFAHVEEPGAVPLCDAEWPDEDLGLMLYDVFDPLRRGEGLPVRPDPVYFRNARVVDARLDCHPDRVELVRRRGGAT